MEFNEKLQQLRTQKNLTQEQLAEQLYVSRTAISKWESGKGYPNIESLKGLSKFFAVSIDDLLSGEELITLAEIENHSNVKRIYNIINGIIDILAFSLIVLPIYGEPRGNHVYSVNLLANTHTPNINLGIHWTIFLLIVVLGVIRLIMIYLHKESLYDIISKVSIIAGGVATCLFAAAREPYCYSCFLRQKYFYY